MDFAWTKNDFPRIAPDPPKKLVLWGGTIYSAFALCRETLAGLGRGGVYKLTARTIHDNANERITDTKEKLYIFCLVKTTEYTYVFLSFCSCSWWRQGPSCRGRRVTPLAATASVRETGSRRRRGLGGDGRMRHSLWGSDLPHDKMTAVQLAQRLRLHLLHRFRVLFVVTCRERATTICHLMRMLLLARQ